MGKKDKRRKNPAAFGPGIDHFLSGAIGNLAVTAALQGCTLNEKMLVAAVIPDIVKIIRAVAPDRQHEELVVRLHLSLIDDPETFLKPEGLGKPS